jgi:hypothetical protein
MCVKFHYHLKRFPSWAVLKFRVVTIYCLKINFNITFTAVTKRFGVVVVI